MAVSTAVAVVDFTAEASAVALSMAVVVSVGDVSAEVVSTAVAFVVAVLAGGITGSLMMSSSAASAFRGCGAGAIRTDITVTAITRTVIMDTADTHTATMVGPVTDTAMAADKGVSGVCGVGDKHGYGSLKYRRPVGV